MLMFTDEAIIDVQAGPGGSGVVSWRREKYVAKGGPDGGDGGNGGNIYLIADPNTDTLSNYLSTKKFKAEPGTSGRKQKMHGKNGEDLFLAVPPGTIVREVAADGEKVLVADLQYTGDQILLAKGGRGGFGNWHFKSAVRQQPDFCEIGEPGEQKTIHLELKLVADVGIIGYPSVGKSTLIRAVSAARPKVAAYEFTTLVPNLGVVLIEDTAFTLCDVPGLIEGASAGKGLGHTFLKHIERCGLLVHVLDISRALVDGEFSTEKLLQDYKAIRAELESYSTILAKKKECIVLNKVDAYPEVPTLVPGIDIFATISAAGRQGTDELMKKLLPLVLEEREKRKQASEAQTDDLPVLRPHESGMQMSSYRIEETDDAVYVRGKRIEQLAQMTDFNSEGAARRFRDICERIGVQKAVRSKANGRPIYIGQIDVTDSFIV